MLPAGIEINNLIQNLDFAPIFLDYAGIDIPDDLQGDSFRKIVNNTSSKWRDAIYYTYYEYPSVHMVKRHYGVRTDRYKLMHFYYDVDEWEIGQPDLVLYTDYFDVKGEAHDWWGSLGVVETGLLEDRYVAAMEY